MQGARKWLSEGEGTPEWISGEFKATSSPDEMEGKCLLFLVTFLLPVVLPETLVILSVVVSFASIFLSNFSHSGEAFSRGNPSGVVQEDSKSCAIMPTSLGLIL